MKINVYEAEQKSGQRKVNRSFLAHYLRSLVDEDLIDLEIDRIP